jgi:hypothetical protein
VKKSLIRTDNILIDGIMNRIIVLSLVIITLLLSHCGNAVKKDVSGLSGNDTGLVKIIFMEYEHDFGKVTEGEKVAYVFKYENQGTSDLVIESAKASCGCTVTEYNTKPIAPGKTGNLKVVFETSGRFGKQTKTITVKSNAKTPVVLLKITAEVVEGNR